MDHAHTTKLLSPLGNQIMKHRASIYVDDVVIFSKPDVADLSAVRSILSAFGEAIGLHTNMAKSRILSIRCENIDLVPLQTAFGC